jgi:hypothetical protein
MAAAAPTGTYQPRWGDLVRYGDEAAAGDEPPQLVVGVVARRTSQSELRVNLREHDGRVGTFAARNLTLVQRPPLPAVLESEDHLIDAFKRDTTDIPPGRSVLPSDFYIAAYAVDLLCAGPEEGGQWYDAGRVVHASWIPRGTRLADALLNELREEWLRVWLRLRGEFDGPDRHNSTGGPDLEVSVIDTWPTDYPAATSTYA